MPKILRSDSCLTCRERKIRCDETRPICRNCSKKRRQCRHAQRDAPQSVDTPTIQAIDESPSSLSCLGDEAWALQIATLSPQQSLQNPAIVELFMHYVTHLAPWYDLNDPQSLFAEIVPRRSLDSPILFKAIIAFAASHRGRTGSDKSTPVAVVLHDAFLRELISALDKIDSSTQADYLAATCLLRSYEILNGDTRTRQQHLFGAFSLAIYSDIDLSAWGLVQAGFWNYLREDITVALECRRPLHIRIEKETPHSMTGSEQDYANTVTYILAKLVNLCFTPQRSEGPNGEDGWKQLSEELTRWKADLPAIFEPLSTAPKKENVFPSLWMLRPWHIAAKQYAYIAEILLLSSKPNQVCVIEKASQSEDLALRICGLAYTNENVAARVNAFGPLAFCGRFLREQEYRRKLRNLLKDMACKTGWNVEDVLKDLYERWGESDLDR